MFVLDGDGSLLMNLGSLATIGWRSRRTSCSSCWDNGLYATTGGQDTATAHGADLEAAARAMGIARDGDGAHRRRADADASHVGDVAAGPWVIVAKVDESAPTAKPPLDCVFIKQRFMAAIGAAGSRRRSA